MAVAVMLVRVVPMSVVARHCVTAASRERPAALATDGRVLRELTPNRPGHARRRVDVGVVVLRVGDDRTGECQVGGRPRGDKTGVEAGELERYDDASRSRCGAGPWMCAPGLPAIGAGRFDATTRYRISPVTASIWMIATPWAPLSTPGGHPGISFSGDRMRHKCPECGLLRVGHRYSRGPCQQQPYSC